jgi:hypothetical protein
MASTHMDPGMAESGGAAIKNQKSGMPLVFCHQETHAGNSCRPRSSRPPPNAGAMADLQLGLDGCAGLTLWLMTSSGVATCPSADPHPKSRSAHALSTCHASGRRPINATGSTRIVPLGVAGRGFHLWMILFSHRCDPNLARLLELQHHVETNGIVRKTC